MKQPGILSACLALTGCAHALTIPQGGRYVALGSSFAAGTAIGGIKPGTPERCRRSPQNYATILAGTLRLDLVDATCGGATTAHILAPWNELPAQIDEVSANARLVTITIGGNDLGYVRNLTAASCDPVKGFSYGGSTVPCPTLKPPTAKDYASLETSLRQIAREVFRRAPQARLVFVQYVRLVPDQPCPQLHMSADGAMVTRVIGERLAATTERAALAEGAEIVAIDRLSEQHTACDAQPWSAGPEPLGPDANAPWHPNKAGHAAIAQALAAKVRES